MQNIQLGSATRSLLRYPGSKARLTKFIAKALLLNEITQPVFVEPFCGGSSVSIALLEAGVVSEVVINDIDPLIASLWKCIFSKQHAAWLAETVMSVPLTLDYWQYQKNLKPRSLREAAFKCLYLNRTSFSGVLHSSAGPIGGRSQAKWTIGCRFNREKIALRILALAKLSSRVRAVTQHSWLEVCNTWRRNNEVFFYLDPPFYHKAGRLYRFVFNHSEHKVLRDYLLKLKCPWLLSYDNADEIRSLYNNYKLNARIIDNTYSAHPMGGNSFIGREVIYTNLGELPVPLKKTSEHVGLSVRKFKIAALSSNNAMRIPMAQV
jgi:DNA adenine methylase